VILGLQRAAQAVLIRLTTELDGLSMLSPPELNALANLATAGSRMTAPALRAAIGCRPTALSRILELLELRGLITHGPGPGDPDAVVELTPAGVGAIRDLERRACAGLPGDSPDHAVAALRALAEAAKQGVRAGRWGAWGRSGSAGRRPVCSPPWRAGPAGCAR
jgi:DNA-binding MarR family transcriptional regulator